LDLEFSDVQRSLRDLIRAFGRDYLTSTAEVGLPLSSDVWRQLCGLGILDLGRVDDGSGLVEQAIVAEELGRVLLGSQYGPCVAYVLPLLDAADDNLVSDIVRGSKRVAFASARRRMSDGATLSGHWSLVPTCQSTDGYLLAEEDGDWGRAWVVPADGGGVEVMPVVDLDLAGKTVNLRLTEAPSRLISTVAADRLRKCETQARVLGAAELIGVADSAISAAAEYAKVRVAFGRPIGSFQGVSHPLAESLAQLEGVRSLVYLAACHFDAHTCEAEQLSLAAKVHAGNVALTATERALHTFGGVGFTWEHPIHRYHRRAIAGRATGGSSLELGHRLGLSVIADLVRSEPRPLDSR
jgi:alkylation response protein AidB-like acyl-CoA dehydrogenase